MPQIFKVSGYLVFLWTQEGDPLEPIHFHITDGVPSSNCTKVWLTAAGHCLLCHNKSKIPPRILNRLMRIVEANSAEFINAWQNHFGEIRFFC